MFGKLMPKMMWQLMPALLRPKKLPETLFWGWEDGGGGMRQYFWLKDIYRSLSGCSIDVDHVSPAT